MSPMKRGKCRKATKGGRPCLRWWRRSRRMSFRKGGFLSDCVIITSLRYPLRGVAIPKTGVGSPILTVARFYVVVIIEISAFEFRFVRFFYDCAGVNGFVCRLFFFFDGFFVGSRFFFNHFYFLRQTISTATSAGFTPDMREA